MCFDADNPLAKQAQNHAVKNLEFCSAQKGLSCAQTYRTTPQGAFSAAEREMTVEIRQSRDLRAGLNPLDPVTTAEVQHSPRCGAVTILLKQESQLGQLAGKVFVLRDPVQQRVDQLANFVTHPLVLATVSAAAHRAGREGGGAEQSRR